VTDAAVTGNPSTPVDAKRNQPMKSLRWLLLAGLLSLGSCPELAVFPADPPVKVAVVKTAKVTPPQAILDALQKCEEDRVDGMAADIALGIAKAAVDKATQDKAAASAAAAGAAAAGASSFFTGAFLDIMLGPLL